MTEKVLAIWRNDRGATFKRLAYKTMMAKREVLESRSPKEFKARYLEVKESIDAYEHLCTKFGAKKDQ